MNSSSGIQAAWIHPEGSLYGIFNTDGDKGNVKISLEDGIYEDLLYGESITIKNRVTALPECAVIFRYNKSINIEPVNSYLLNIDSN